MSSETLRSLKRDFLGMRLSVDDIINENQYETYSEEDDGWYECEIKDYDMVNTYTFRVQVVDDILLDLSIGTREYLESEDATRCSFSSHRMDSSGLGEISGRLANAVDMYSYFGYCNVVSEELADLADYCEGLIDELRSVRSKVGVRKIVNKHKLSGDGCILLLWMLLDQSATYKREILLKKRDRDIVQMIVPCLPEGWMKLPLRFIAGQAPMDVKSAFLSRHPMHKKAIAKTLRDFQ